MRRNNRSRGGGGPQFSGPSRRLPPASYQDRPSSYGSMFEPELRPTHADALRGGAGVHDWGMGRSPITAWSFEVHPAGTHRHTTLPAKQIFRAQEYWLRSLQVRAPARVRFCIQRKSRREVLFAKGRAGYSGSARKRYWRRNGNSAYSC